METVRPKVIYVLPLYDEKTGTHFYYNYELIREASRRMDIFVVIEKAAGEIDPNIKCYVQKFRNPILRFFELWLKCFKLHISGFKNVYVHYSYYGALAGFLSGMKVFYWNRGMPWLFKRGLWEEFLFRFILRRSILVTGPESLAGEYVKRYGVKNYRILSNWVDVERFRPTESKEASKSWLGLRGKKVILFVHHLSERKGADLIAKIAKGFGKETVFVVIGDGPYRKILEKESSDLGLPVKILGEVPNKDIPAYFRAADVFLMPSREEGSPHVILESMASGTPFVAADIGGVKVIAPPGFEEFLCRSGDIECFKSKISKLIEDGPLYEKFRSDGFRFVDKLNLAMGAAQFENLFRQS